MSENGAVAARNMSLNRANGRNLLKTRVTTPFGACAFAEFTLERSEGLRAGFARGEKAAAPCKACRSQAIGCNLLKTRVAPPFETCPEPAKDAVARMLSRSAADGLNLLKTRVQKGGSFAAALQN
jgi:hypothetical protein